MNRTSYGVSQGEPRGAKQLTPLLEEATVPLNSARAVQHVDYGLYSELLRYILTASFLGPFSESPPRKGNHKTFVLL